MAACSKFGDPSLITTEDQFDNWIDGVNSICTTPQYIQSVYAPHSSSLSFVMDHLHYHNLEKFFDAMMGHGYTPAGDGVYKFTVDYPAAKAVLAKDESVVIVEHTFHQISISIK